MSEPQKTSARKPGLHESATAQAAPPETGADATPASAANHPPTVADAEPSSATGPAPPVLAEAAHSAQSPQHATAQVIDLDAVRANERKATLAYVAEVHELCALTGRGDLAAGFIANATPVAQIRRALLEARAAEDEATALRSQVRPATTEPGQPAIDTAAIYAARNQHCR
jgi:hypothetical protein